MTVLVALEGVGKVYGRSWNKGPQRAVRDVSLEIREGEAFGFVGPNGAGKSTTIKMLMGAIRPSEGSIRVLGFDVSDPRSRLRLGYVPENPCLSDYLTPLEILTMALRLHGVRPSDPLRHCMAWLERFQLAHVAKKSIRTFSKGMTQRVALAHAMAIEPRLLVLDEPLSGLDPVGRRDVVDILFEYNRAGGTIFFSSHVLYDVERLADRFGLIHRGDLLTIRSPQELATDRASEYVAVYRGPLVAGANEVRPGWRELAVGVADLPEAIASIRAAGGCLHEVRPAVSLETVFLQLVRNVPPGAGEGVKAPAPTEA